MLQNSRRTASVAVRVDYELPQTLVFCVADTGPGMSADQQARLFQRFSQVDGSLSRAHGGTGLGLAICKGLVEAMGGTIGVTSELGKGSTFRVALPCPMSVMVAHETRPGVVAFNLAAYRVLVVDDNASNRALVAASLKSTGIELATAQDGQEAVKMASRQPFDLILLDLHMPGMDGLHSAVLDPQWRGAEPGRADHGIHGRCRWVRDASPARRRI